jgi:hypothetical protein
MNKLLVRLGVAGAVAAGTVWAVRKYRASRPQVEELLQQRVAQATEVVQQSVAQVTELANKVQTYFDVAMTQLATSWLGESPDNGEPDEPEDKRPEGEKPADQYTNNAPLLDDGR